MESRLSPPFLSIWEFTFLPAHFRGRLDGSLPRRVRDTGRGWPHKAPALEDIRSHHSPNGETRFHSSFGRDILSWCQGRSGTSKRPPVTSRPHETAPKPHQKPDPLLFAAPRPCMHDNGSPGPPAPLRAPLSTTGPETAYTAPDALKRSPPPARKSHLPHPRAH